MAKQIHVGGLPVGGGAPVTIQSMTNTKTEDVASTVSQIKRLQGLGCQIVRLAVPTLEAARAIAAIRTQTDIPLVADIHFDYRLALEAVAAGIDKIRLNPGNIGDPDRVRQVADACRSRGIPIRIGVNAGSLEKDVLSRHGRTPAAMLASAMNHVRLLNRFDFDDICISVKASDVRLTIAAYRLLARETDYPLHLGVTEAGTFRAGLVKSAMGIGCLLLEGIGDTIRVSLTEDPAEEVRAAKDILRAAGIRREGAELISCPSCGRCEIDLIPIAKEVEARLTGITKPLTVAVMGCAVNGPGEAAEADYGIAGGQKSGLIFQKGEIVERVPMCALVDHLMKRIEADL